VHLGLAIAERAYVLRHGTVTLTGAAAQLRDDASLLQESYLGSTDDYERTIA
jgi:ABC-type branched-subunit amino acid transport system ATPase component